MDSILNFMNKWGLFILLFFALTITLSTCGVKTQIEHLNKHVLALEQTININDSLNKEINSTEREIANLEVSRNVVYDNNKIVRTAARPDDVMNEYDQKIKALQEKLNKLKNVGRK